METETIKKTWGEREGVSLELLRKFTKPGHEHWGEVRQHWNYRGDGTATGERRMRSLLGDEAMEHLNYDAVACTGGIMVIVPRWKFQQQDSRPGPSLPAQYYWAMSSIAEDPPEERCGIRPCTPEEIAAVVPETQELLSALPGLQFMRIAKVGFFSSDKPGKRQWMDAPQGVRYFRFAAGYGLVAIEPGVGKEGR